MVNLIDDAFWSVNRVDFLPPEVRDQAGLDKPLPIGYGQTNSQPSTVAMMLEWLVPQSGDKVLDVGYGSGWTTALLSYIVGDSGRVYAVEIVPELAEFGKHNCNKAGVGNAHFFLADDNIGLPEHAPYDRILVSAAAAAVPPELVDQLRAGGKMVIPLDTDLMEITKTGDHMYDAVRHPGFSFVPLI